jgi:hypothetical protein
VAALDRLPHALWPTKSIHLVGLDPGLRWPCSSAPNENLDGQVVTGNMQLGIEIVNLQMEVSNTKDTEDDKWIHAAIKTLQCNDD